MVSQSPPHFSLPHFRSCPKELDTRTDGLPALGRRLISRVAFTYLGSTTNALNLYTPCGSPDKQMTIPSAMDSSKAAPRARSEWMNPQTQRNAGKIGPCKNVTANRTVLLQDTEGQRAMWELRRFLGNASNPNALVFHSKRGGPRPGDHHTKSRFISGPKNSRSKASRNAPFVGAATAGENSPGLTPPSFASRWGMASAAMTALYTGEIPLEHVQAEFSSKIGNQIVVLENMENEAFA